MYCVVLQNELVDVIDSWEDTIILKLCDQGGSEGVQLRVYAVLMEMVAS